MLVQNLNFIFQTKDPAKYFDYLALMPKGSWLGTTIETDSSFSYSVLKVSKAPDPTSRYLEFRLLRRDENYKYFVTIEPIMKFTKYLKYFLSEIDPDIIFIGANTSKVQLPEPSPDEVMELVIELSKITKVYLKSNLKRLVTPEFYLKWKTGSFE